MGAYQRAVPFFRVFLNNSCLIGFHASVLGVSLTPFTDIKEKKNRRQ